MIRAFAVLVALALLGASAHAVISHIADGYASPHAITTLALAAGIVLFLQTQETNLRPHSEVALAKARSTQPLFDEPFHAGETSARIDKIAMARASDYRNNYFAKRGVK